MSFHREPSGETEVSLALVGRSLTYECVPLTGSQAKAGLTHRITFQRPHTAQGGQPPAMVYFSTIETDQQAQTAARISRSSGSPLRFQRASPIRFRCSTEGRMPALSRNSRIRRGFEVNSPKARKTAGQQIVPSPMVQCRSA